MSAALNPIQYWFPGRRAVPPAFAAAMARRYGPNPEHCASLTSEGPKPDARGILIGYGSNRAVSYQARTYRWYRIPDDGWIGVWKGATPAQFLRGRTPTVPGVAVELGDGHSWCIPVANPLMHTCTLPCAEVLIDGSWQRTPLDAYAHLSEMAIDIAARYRASLIDGTPFGMDENDLRQYCADIIAINYALDITEMGALHLFTAPIWRRLLEAFIDWPGYLQILIAEQAAIREAGTDADLHPTSPESPATSATPPGEPDTAPSIAPPSPTSI